MTESKEIIKAKKLLDNENIGYYKPGNPIVYVIQELPGTKMGAPKINIMSAKKYGEFKFLLPEFSQIIFSPGPLIFPESYNIAMLSSNTFDLPVPISIKYAKYRFSHESSNAFI